MHIVKAIAIFKCSVLFSLLGGHEVNPANIEIHFNETIQGDQPWEFSPYGHIESEVCKKDDSAIMWDEGNGTRQFTTKQLIVQMNYILQFKVSTGKFPPKYFFKENTKHQF